MPRSTACRPGSSIRCSVSRRRGLRQHRRRPDPRPPRLRRRQPRRRGDGDVPGDRVRPLAHCRRARPAGRRDPRDDSRSAARGRCCRRSSSPSLIGVAIGGVAYLGGLPPAARRPGGHPARRVDRVDDRVPGRGGRADRSPPPNASRRSCPTDVLRVGDSNVLPSDRLWVVAVVAGVERRRRRALPRAPGSDWRRGRGGERQGGDARRPVADQAGAGQLAARRVARLDRRRADQPDQWRQPVQLQPVRRPCAGRRARRGAASRSASRWAPASLSACSRGSPCTSSPERMVPDMLLSGLDSVVPFVAIVLVLVALGRSMPDRGTILDRRFPDTPFPPRRPAVTVATVADRPDWCCAVRRAVAAPRRRSPR